ncbi:hypothetical protein RT99_14775 [Flavobacterium sp. MEB061]|uniref:hypothetical protein n=1 Tax=Flavobacterium sp. MEB061 TaxID=1587524 RepID=UPI0005AC5FAC|nr:hypothetical protein [Flavobacterium sp. MEB061]KIQ19974.1 hypothetical protein RT99_14775 [Flavobacterium sp. MEB061]
MEGNQTLGGTRHSNPLANEMSYPLTHDEYLTLRDNLEFSKFNNWEAFLLSTLITTVISLIVICSTVNFYINVKEKGVSMQKIDMGNLIVIIVYSAITLASLVCLIVSLCSKKKSKSSLERLDVKITNHLENS